MSALCASESDIKIDQLSTDVATLAYWKDFCNFCQNNLKDSQEIATTGSESDAFETAGFSLLLDVGGQEAANLLHENGIDGKDALRFTLVLCKLEELYLLKIVVLHEQYKHSIASDPKVDLPTTQSFNYNIENTGKSCDILKEKEGYRLSALSINRASWSESNFIVHVKGEPCSNDCQEEASHYGGDRNDDENLRTSNENKEANRHIDTLKSAPFLEANNDSVIVKNRRKKKVISGEAKIGLETKGTSNVRKSSRQIKVSSRYSENKEAIQNLLKPDVKVTKKNDFSDFPIVCSICKKHFKSPKGLLTHWRSHLQINKRKKCLPFLCQVCGNAFNEYDQFQIHFKQHNDGKDGDKRNRKLVSSVQVKETSQDVEEENGKLDDIGYELIHDNDKGKEYLESEEDIAAHDISCESKCEDNKFECKHCHKIFTNIESLSKHEKRHVGHKHSSKRPVGQKLMQLKNKRMYRKMGQFQCKVCNKSYKYERNLDLHTTLHTGEKPNECHICGKGFRMKRSLVSHLRFHDKESHVKCEICPKTFVDQKALEHHLLIHSGEKPFSCDTCGKKFRRLLGLRNHRRLHKKDEAIKCDLCDKIFVDKWGMLKHRTIHTGEKPFICSECGKMFRLKKGLMDHAKLHDKNSHLKCSLCPRTFVEQRKLDLHLIAHSGEKPFICDKCGKGFMNAMNLKVHNRCHTGEKPYKCSFCEKSFNQQGPLITHERHHKGERPYVCDICGDCYITKSQLTVHIRKHFNDRPYKCDQCDYAAYTGSQLKIHKLKHSTEKPYKCSLCSSAFKRQHHLEVHSRTHIANPNSDIVKTEKIYNCPYCESSFISEDLLSSHLATHEIVVITTETQPDDNNIFVDQGPDEVAYNIVLL